MKKKNIVLVASSVLLLSTTACSSMMGGGAPLMSSSKNSDVTMGNPSAGDTGGAVIPPTFAQFTDIPIPEQSVMDLKRSLVFGGQSSWSGRLVFTAPYSQGGLFDFYMAEMPKFGWQEITVVRSQSSVLSFRQGNRVATIQLEGDSSGTDVAFTVSPSTSRAKSHQ